MENAILVLLNGYNPIIIIMGLIAIGLLYTYYCYLTAVNYWFDEYVFNTINNIPEKPKYKPDILKQVFGSNTLDSIMKNFNENNKEELNKYEYLKKTIEDVKYRETFGELCVKYNIKNTRLFKNFINGKAKHSISIKQKNNEYLKAIKRIQKKYENEMWNSWKLKTEFEY